MGTTAEEIKEYLDSKKVTLINSNGKLYCKALKGVTEKAMVPGLRELIRLHKEALLKLALKENVPST